MRRLKDLSQDELYEIMGYVSELRNTGLSYSEISKVVAENSGVRISKATVIRWCKGIHNPLNRIKEVNLKPSPDVSYVIGVYFGDASVNADKRYRYRIRLKVIDREFAEEFAKALKSLGLSPRLYYENDSTRSGRWSVEATSKELYLFLIRPREVLFDIAKLYPREFLRGFFDSEGCVCLDRKRKQAFISASNYDIGLLRFCKELLEDIGIESTIVLTKKKGSKVVIRGKEYRYTSDLYEIRISKLQSIRAFHIEIGFTIERKQKLLQSYMDYVTGRTFTL